MKKEIYEKRQKHVIVDEASESNKRARYVQAARNRSILLGDRHDGVDWSHYNFLLSVVKWKKCNTLLDATRTLWKHFFPYLDNLLKAYADTRNLLEMEWKDSDKILKEYAKTITEQKLAVEFIRQQDLAPEFESFKLNFESTIGKHSEEEVSKRVKKD